MTAGYVTNRGSYWYNEIECPHCAKLTIFRYVESVGSHAGLRQTCKHAKSYSVNDDGIEVQFSETNEDWDGSSYTDEEAAQ